ncbi:MAG: ATP-binding protein [Xanthobacteraceae bacterium]
MSGAREQFQITRATPELISLLIARVISFLEGQKVESRVARHTGLILDELLTNLAMHGDGADRAATVSITIESDRVSGEIVDSGDPFDPRLARDPSLDLDADARPIGGLGLYLVRKLSCTLEYARLSGENRTTFAINRGNSSGEGSQADGNS